MRRYRLLILAAVLLCAGVILRYAAPSMLGLAPASAARGSYVTPNTWREAGARLEPYLVQARFAKIPDRLALLVFKDRKQMEVWGGDAGSWRFLRAYPVLAASGLSGPKLRDGDRQVPEGIYRMSLMNPNNSYYLAMKLDYPNAFDQQKA
jgi:murein L,D-transpeptidase YafK